jgi:hypothetical protein
MKPLLISLLAGAGLAFTAAKKPVGPCEPYAETCRHCTDCSQCKHCAKDGGKCSVCFKR